MHANNETGYLGLCVELPPPEDRLSEGSMALLGRWNVYAPDQHRWWKWYTISCVHLRDVSPLPKPKLQFKGATHEISVLVNNPYNTDQVMKGGFWPLFPPNVVVQGVFKSDQDAYNCAKELYELALGRRILLEVSGIDGARDMWDDHVREWTGR